MNNISLPVRIAGGITAEVGSVLSGRIPYARLAAKLGMPGFPAPWATHPLKEVIQQLDLLDRAAGRPLRSAVIVNERRGGLPGGGFFRSLELTTGVRLRTKAQKREAWQAYREQVFAYYSAHTEAL